MHRILPKTLRQTHVAEEVTDAWRALAAGGAG